MVSTKQDLETVAGADESGIEVTYSGGHSVTVAVDEVMEDSEPEHLEHEAGPDVWDEGRLAVDCYSPDPPGSWATGYCRLEARTDEGDWQQVELYVGDPDAGHPLDRESASYSVARLQAVERPQDDE